jgi:hypothetical protein
MNKLKLNTNNKLIKKQAISRVNNGSNFFNPIDLINWKTTFLTFSFHKVITIWRNLFLKNREFHVKSTLYSTHLSEWIKHSKALLSEEINPKGINWWGNQKNNITEQINIWLKIEHLASVFFERSQGNQLNQELKTTGGYLNC